MWPNSLSHLWQIVAIFADCVWIFFYMLISKHRSNIDCLKHLIFWRTVSCGFFGQLLSLICCLHLHWEKAILLEGDSGYPSTFAWSCLLLCPNDRSTSLPLFPFLLSHLPSALWWRIHLRILCCCSLQVDAVPKAQAWRSMQFRRLSHFILPSCIDQKLFY